MKFSRLATHYPVPNNLIQTLKETVCFLSSNELYYFIMTCGIQSMERKIGMMGKIRIESCSIVVEGEE
jgi:hypothetical protein